MLKRNLPNKNRMLHLSKIISLAFFVLTPILAGITSGLLVSNSLFWSWIVFGLACLLWFIVAVVMTNRMKPVRVASYRSSVAQKT